MQADRADINPGLRERCREWALKITASSIELVKKNGACEHYNPLTGDGQRLRVENFGWSYLAYIMTLGEKIERDKLA